MKKVQKYSQQNKPIFPEIILLIIQKMGSIMYNWIIITGAFLSKQHLKCFSK